MPSASQDKNTIRLEVRIPSATVLKVLWLTNMQKGKLSIETENELPKGKPVTVVLVLMAQTIEFAATVVGSTAKVAGKGKGGGYFTNVEFELNAALRESVEKVTGHIKEHKSSKGRKNLDDTDIDLGEE
jgi:hypothetical protein